MILDPSINYAASARVPDGYSIQVYRQAAGYTDDAMLLESPKWASDGVRYVILHEFVGGDLTRTKYEDLAGRITQSSGLEVGAAFGLGGLNRDHPASTGSWIRSIFTSPMCKLGLIDAEGAFDNNAKDKALAMVDALTLGGTSRDFGIPIGDQLWFAILSHPNFPVREFIPALTFRGEQEYGNDFKGRTRWEICRSWRDRDWAREDASLPATMLLPHMATIEGYGYGSDRNDTPVPWEATTELLRWPSAQIWCEWKPSAETRMALRFVQFMKQRGYSLATDMSGVIAFQRDAGLTQDGKAGLATWAAAGITTSGL